MNTDTVSLEDYKRQLAELTANGQQAFQQAATPEELEQARIEYLGDQRGKLREFQVALGSLPKDARPDAGRQFNSAKSTLTAALEQRRAELARAASAAEGRPA